MRHSIKTTASMSWAVGFSLVELSIVLVILGLLAGGVLSGQSLIRAAELRAITNDFERYSTVMYTFRDKYMALPGDMPNAESFFGQNSACGGTVAAGTCNGNGNGKIEEGVADKPAEVFMAWQQLQKAGLVEGTYSGISGHGSGYDAVIGTNVPSARIKNSSWTILYFDKGNMTVNYVLGQAYGNTFVFGTKTPDFETGYPALKPEEAWNIDTKIDDGKPARGKVIARFWNDACAAADDGTSANDDLNASYRLTDSSIQCALFIRDSY